jgi:hypothetical protein
MERFRKIICGSNDLIFRADKPVFLLPFFLTKPKVQENPVTSLDVSAIFLKTGSLILSAENKARYQFWRIAKTNWLFGILLTR